MLHHCRLILSLMIGLVITPALYTDSNAEREVLTRLLHELETIELLIKQAEA